jgi:hypothetical protein
LGSGKPPKARGSISSALGRSKEIWPEIRSFLGQRKAMPHKALEAFGNAPGSFAA